MFRNTKITTRFLVSTSVAIVLVLTFSFLFTFQHMKSMMRDSEQGSMQHLSETILTEVESEGLRAQSMAAVVAGIPQVQEAFAARNREALQALFADGFGILKKDYGARQFQFHAPPATSFLRIHKLKKFGDDLSGFRHTVVETNRSKKPIKGLEVGASGLGVRGIVPVFHAGNHVGSVEFGMSFGKPFLERLAHEHGIDIALGIKRDGKMKPFARTFGDAKLLTKAEKQSVLSEQPLYARRDLNGKPVSVYARKVKNYSDAPIGLLVIAKDRTEQVASITGLRNMILLLGLLSVLILVLLVWFISRGVVKPLCLASKQMNEIAYGSGNLSDRLDETGEDEISYMAKAYNAFVGKIESTINEVVATSNNLALMVGDFTDLTHHTNQGASKQRDMTTHVATAMTEMSSTIREVAQNTSSTADTASEVDQQSGAGQQVVKSAMDSINSLAEEIGRAVETVRQVEHDSENIGSVLDVIRGIADQTNLLALNAAIEAARAGEQGRGFAVVADEVRTLAQRTQDSTQEIQQMIEGLQSGVSNTVTVMEASQEQASQSVEQAASAHDALATITQSIDTINAMSTQIATASEEQSAVAQEISQNIVEISDISQHTADDSQQTIDATERLAESVETLVQLMGNFRTGNRYANELHRAQSTHLAWKGKLQNFLEGRGTIDEKTAFSHHDCAFGKWYDTVGLSELGHLDELHQIEPPHKEMHDTIKRIAQLKQNGDLEAAQNEYKKVAPLSKDIVSLINALVKKV